MKFFQSVVSLLLIFSIPTMATPPISIDSSCSSSTEETSFLEDVSFPTYDEIVAYIERVENEDLERICNPQDLDKLNLFITQLAKVGSLSEEGEEAEELYADIEDLLSSEEIPYGFAYSINGNIAFPAIFGGTQCQTTLCKSWIKKTCHKVKKFVKKHKKEILIGAAVVVAATVVVVAVVAVSSAVTAATAAGAAGAASSSSSGSETSSLGSGEKELGQSELKEEVSSVPAIPQNFPPSVTDAKETPTMKAPFDDQVSSFKEFLAEDNVAQQSTFSGGWDDLSFKEKARELGAHLAHQAYEEVSELARVVPQLCEEVKEMGSKLLPESILLSSGSPLENHENLVAMGHKAIDNVFSTDQAELYTSGTRVNNLINDFAIGIVSLPGLLSSNGSINVEEFSRLGSVADRAGFTKAGRSLMKHGYREGSIFPKPVGTPSDVNKHGQKVLESILNHPEKKISQYTHKLHGPVIEIEAPQLGGIRFNGDGTEMMGFLEPRSFINGK